MSTGAPSPRITERFFWTENHPIIGLVQSMYDHTKVAKRELDLLAQSFGAEAGVWRDTKPFGFVFAQLADVPKWLKATSAMHQGRIVMEPRKGGTLASFTLSQMKKLSIPNYSDAPYTLGLFRYNTFRSTDYLNRVWLGFTREGDRVTRVFVAVPYWAPGNPPPELKLLVNPGTQYDTPEPEGWTEWSRSAMVQFTEEKKEENQP